MPQFLDFIRAQAKQLRADDQPPKSLDEWNRQRQQLRRKLIKSWGSFPKDACDLEPRIVGTLKRDGYRIEKLLLQTRPGVLMTANAYVPDSPGKHPAVLCVHGHWRHAKSEPVVQARCHGLAKLGFVVLMVDALGAGERGINKPLGEYHGEMVAGTLWPSGLSLAGLQVYENMRAVDYLQSRPEVDADHIGVTGASGGGNQTMYVGAVDERIKCVVPVCSVGTYQAYLGPACCMCEVTPGALSYTEEWGVLGLVAPRGLMLINATRDGIQFSVGEAKKSLAGARRVFDLYGKSQNAKHAVFESNHDYSQPMREAMYGWMTLHLKGEGDGSPIAEPKFKTEAAETLRCFPGNSRPDKFVTLPQLAAAEGRRLNANRKVPTHGEQWESELMLMRESLVRVLGGLPRTQPTDFKRWDKDGSRYFSFTPEPGITVQARQLQTGAKNVKKRGLAVLLDLDNGTSAATSQLAAKLVEADWNVVVPDLRASGKGFNGGNIGRAVDHNTAEWSMWIGRPLLGQWVKDVISLLDVTEKHARGRAGRANGSHRQRHSKSDRSVCWRSGQPH